MDTVSAQQLLSFPKKYYPIFDVCHIILCVLTVRKEAGRDFAWKRPFATWLSCIVSSFAGSLLANPLLGKPMFGAFADEYLLLLATIIYIVIFFSPGDVGYKLIKWTPVYVTICFIKEIYRGKKIYAGIQDGRKAFPESKYFVPVVTAVLKGNGSAFIAPVSRLIRGDWRPSSSEFLKPSVTTKECLLGAILMITMGIEQDIMYLALVSLFVSVKIAGVFGSTVDPFQPVEAIVYGIVGMETAEEKQE